MDSQTYSLFQAIGSRTASESLDLLLALLEKPGKVEDLAARTGMASATASRRLDDLALSGVVGRSRPRGPYELTDAELTRRFLEAAGNLADAVLKRRVAGEAQLRRRIKKTRLTLKSHEDTSNSP